MDVYILFPHGRVSEVQRRQMTTVDAGNVHCIALDGTFDDCQALVKAMFNDVAFRKRISMAAVNSINWARVMAQSAYYVASAVRLGAPDRSVAYSVPSANFGAAFAGYVALQMGLPIEKFIVATNANDILHRFLETGGGTAQPVCSRPFRPAWISRFQATSSVCCLSFMGAMLTPMHASWPGFPSQAASKLMHRPIKQRNR